MRIAVFHPGAMGSKLAAQLVAAGHEVHWVPEGRSEASVARAAEAGLIGTPFAEAVREAEAVLCSCAPQGAVDIAKQVGSAGFGGLYIEANPLSPMSLREAQSAVPEATFVDAGVVGPPPTGGPSPTHLMLSGAAAEQAAELWAGTAVTPMVVGASQVRPARRSRRTPSTTRARRRWRCWPSSSRRSTASRTR